VALRNFKDSHLLLLHLLFAYDGEWKVLF